MKFNIISTLIAFIVFIVVINSTSKNWALLIFAIDVISYSCGYLRAKHDYNL